jgi:hypothetical protein
VLSLLEGQVAENQVYLNQDSSPAFLGLLNALAGRVALQGHVGYAGGLDTKRNNTGEHSYYTQFAANELMFHVATMLPFTPNDRQQVSRKRHIGNDCVVIVHLAHDAPPFQPDNFVSKFQLVFVVIRDVDGGEEGGGKGYKVKTVRLQEVPCFDALDRASVFDSTAVANGSFRQFVLATVINAENASYSSVRLLKLLDRTRRALLDDIVSSYASEVPVVPEVRRKSTLTRLLSSRKKKDRTQIDLSLFNLSTLANAEVRWLKLAGFDGREDDAGLVLSDTMFVVIDQATTSTLHQFPITATTAWYSTDEERHSLTMVFGKHDESITVFCNCAADRAAIESRLRTIAGTKQLTHMVVSRPVRCAFSDRN